MIITIKVKPNSLKTEIISKSNKEWVIAVAAPPEKNKANIELIKFFRRELGLNVKIKSGASSRKKVIEIIG